MMILICRLLSKNFKLLVMIKNKIAVFVIILVLFSMNIFSQQSRFDNIQSRKIAFFTEKLNLTPSEATQFWPVYNDYQNRKGKITQERNAFIRYYNQNSQNMPAEEIKKSLEKYVQFQRDETVLLETYNEKFKKILPEEKVLKIYITEIQFRNYLLQQLKENRPTQKHHLTRTL